MSCSEAQTRNATCKVAINKDIKITIAGGGIGGMMLALSLHAAGFQKIEIYEAASKISEAGVGINIQPSAVRELIELGLGDELEKKGIPTAEIQYYHINGQKIYQEPRGKAAGYKWPQYSIHRGELLGILYNAVCDRLGRSIIRTGSRLIECGNSDTGAWASFDINEGNGTREAASMVYSDILIGCDGVHSNVRKALTKEGAPAWTGITMLRGVTKMKPFLSGRSMIIVGPIEREMVVYPISKEAENKDMSLVNWVALKKTEKEQMIQKETWNVEVEDLDEVIKPFEDFKYDFLDVPKMIREAEKVFQYPMIDRTPLDSWYYGNITLLGDAAHPMIPIGANGATQGTHTNAIFAVFLKSSCLISLLNSNNRLRALAFELCNNPTIEKALLAYDTQRREAVNRVVKANREESETRFLEIIHDAFPSSDGKEHDFDSVITEQDIVAISRKYKDVAGFSAQTLNQRESYTCEIEAE
eukprot:CAMPEP_0195256014 /NCGR_PEP_ID=MMETSP0706-20130129/5987_1 /TAXON_ID=33640 /ORGANISM="Asterionellopsis glacialis, Strain CCMP134" /LENGTH=472 /DNA_ID=CAMNT_0040308983 /DNA_START=349 /DNA_END=1768 /DNA_ORIENTATION=+